MEKLLAAHRGAELQFFGNHAPLKDPKAFAAYLAPLRKSEWVVYSKRPFGGPREVLRYLARYTHRVAISNRRLIACDDKDVTFKWKDYRIKGPERYKRMPHTPSRIARSRRGTAKQPARALQRPSPSNIAASAASQSPTPNWCLAASSAIVRRCACVSPSKPTTIA
jgi:hypothetical protein